MATSQKKVVEAASARISGNDDETVDSSQVDQTDEVDPNLSTAGLDKLARMKAELASAEDALEDRPQVVAQYAVEGNDTSAYVGVNQEYMNYANETEKPLLAEEGSAERYFEDQLTSSKKFAVAAVPGSNQTEGGGSSVPLLYPDVSGENYVNEPVKVNEAPVGEDVLDSDAAPTQTREGATPSTTVEPSEF